MHHLGLQQNGNLSISVFTMNESFPMNAWYAVAWDVEVKSELLARKVCNKSLVIYRRKDGTPVVLEDAC